MVETTEVALGVAVFALFVWFGYRAVTAARLYRSLSGTESYSSAGMVDGETAAVEGEVVVDEPAPAAEQVVDGAESPVGAYLWRSKYPDSGNDYKIDKEGFGREMNTFASGIESGTFRVVDGGREIRVDPEWLTETHDSTDIEALSLEGMQTSSPLSKRTWASPYVHLTDHVTEQSFEGMEDFVDEDATGVDPTRNYLESRAVPEGERLAVRGEIQIEQGEPVIRGSDETPLALSDQGFDGLGSDLRRTVAKYGAVSLGLLTAAVILLGRGFAVGPF